MRDFSRDSVLFKPMFVVNGPGTLPHLELRHLTSTFHLRMPLCESMVSRPGAFPQPDCCHFLTELHLLLSGLPLTLFDTMSNRMLGLEDEV